MTFDNFLKLVDSLYLSEKAQNKLRYGQTIMNVLYSIWPEKYKEITNTDYDCFYDNATVKLTLQKLEKDWIDQ